MGLYLNKLPVRREEWEELAVALLGDGDLLRIAANCYVLLEKHAVDAYNSRVQHSDRFEGYRVDAFRDLPKRGYRIDDVRLFVAMAADGKLFGIAGLFAAVAAALEPMLAGENEPVVAEASPAFAGIHVLIGPDRPGPVRRGLSQRTQDEISDPLSVLYPGLHIHRERVSGISLRSRPLAWATKCYLEKLGEAARVAVAPLSGTAKLTGESCNPVPPKPERGFWLTGTGDEAAELAALDAAFDACYEARAAILVLPELRMPDRLDRRLRELLDAQEEVRILLVAAGSWHVKEGEGWRNRCRLYDHRGETIFEHDKLCEFRLTARNVEQDLSCGMHWGSMGTAGLRISGGEKSCDSAIRRLDG